MCVCVCVCVCVYTAHYTGDTINAQYNILLQTIVFYKLSFQNYLSRLYVFQYSFVNLEK